MKQLINKGFLAPALLAISFAAPVAAQEMPVFALDLNDGVVTPGVLNVPAGITFKINLKNSGTGPAEFESRRLRKEKVLAPGAASFVVIRRLTPGSYKFFDEFHSAVASAQGVIVAK